jgi:uncharacterized protein YqhQ
MMKIQIEILTLISILDAAQLQFMICSSWQFSVLLRCLIPVSLNDGVSFLTVANDGISEFLKVVFQFAIRIAYIYRVIKKSLCTR